MISVQIMHDADSFQSQKIEYGIENKNKPFLNYLLIFHLTLFPFCIHKFGKNKSLRCVKMFRVCVLISYCRNEMRIMSCFFHST